MGTNLIAFNVSASLWYSKSINVLSYQNRKVDFCAFEDLLCDFRIYLESLKAKTDPFSKQTVFHDAPSWF